MAKIKILIPLPKTRKPIAKKCNSRMKSQKDYTRKIKNKKKRQEQF